MAKELSRRISRIIEVAASKKTALFVGLVTFLALKPDDRQKYIYFKFITFPTWRLMSVSNYTAVSPTVLCKFI